MLTAAVLAPLCFSFLFTVVDSIVHAVLVYSVTLSVLLPYALPLFLAKRAVKDEVDAGTARDYELAPLAGGVVCRAKIVATTWYCVTSVGVFVTAVAVIGNALSYLSTTRYHTEVGIAVAVAHAQLLKFELIAGLIMPTFAFAALVSHRRKTIQLAFYGFCALCLGFVSVVGFYFSDNMIGTTKGANFFSLRSLLFQGLTFIFTLTVMLWPLYKAYRYACTHFWRIFAVD